jgi:3-oxoadipate enol-lactonase
MSDLFFREWNSEAGTPVVLIHAFPLTHAMWEKQIAALQEKFHVLAYDVRGLGRSLLGDGQFTMEHFVDDLFALMDRLKLDRAALCGLSLGGYIALRAAEKRPERVGALVLCDTRSEADDNTGKLKRAQSIQLIQTKGVDAFAKGFVPNLVSETTKKEKPELLEALLQTVRSQSPQGICAAQLAMLSRTDTTESLGKISCPTLVIHGEADAVIPLAQAEKMQKNIPDSRLAVVSQAGHLSNLEVPGEFNRHLAAFLESRGRT